MVRLLRCPCVRLDAARLVDGDLAVVGGGHRPPVEKVAGVVELDRGAGPEVAGPLEGVPDLRRDRALRRRPVGGEAPEVAEDAGERALGAGEEDGQGVGYLDDGTMIVVENGRPYIGQDVNITVTSVLQTSAGRMIFGRFVFRKGTGSSIATPGSTQIGTMLSNTSTR